MSSSFWAALWPITHIIQSLAANQTGNPWKWTPPSAPFYLIKITNHVGALELWRHWVFFPPNYPTTITHLCRGIQAGPGASAQRVTLAHREQRGRHDRTKVIEGPTPHSLCLLCDAADLPWVFGEQLAQQRLFCVAVAAEGTSHAKQAGDNVPAQVV